MSGLCALFAGLCLYFLLVFVVKLKVLGLKNGDPLGLELVTVLAALSFSLSFYFLLMVIFT